MRRGSASASARRRRPSTGSRAGLLAAWLETSVGDLTLARADLEEAQRVADGLGDDALAADVERHRAFLAIQEGRPADVHAAAAAALAVCRAGLGRLGHRRGAPARRRTGR